MIHGFHLGWGGYCGSVRLGIAREGEKGFKGEEIGPSRMANGQRFTACARGDCDFIKPLEIESF